MIIPFNIEYKGRYENSHLSFIEPILRIAYNNKVELENALENILLPFSFLLGSELKKATPNHDVIKNCLNTLKIAKIGFEVVDSSLLITPIETRGEQMQLLKSSYQEKLLFLENFFELKKRIPPIWIELISIIKTITLVTIPGKENLLNHFSGSDTDRWGAIHMGKNLEFFNIAECLTHEASHHWMNLYDFYNEVEFIQNGWSDHSYISPWRRDKRPLMGIFHGIYVFTNVFIILQYLKAFQNKSYNSRLYFIAAQVRRGIEILDFNLNKMSATAKDLFFQIQAVFDNAYESLPLNERTRYYNQVLNEEQSKNKVV